jgi:hypothetical protein
MGSFDVGFIKPRKDGGKRPNNGNYNVQSLMSADVDIPYGFHLGGGKALKPVVSSGSVLLAEYSASKSTGNTSYTKVYGFTVGLGGTYRISFDGYTTGSNGKAKIYVNGIAVGTERDLTVGMVTYTEDFLVNPGDEIQFYIRAVSSGNPVIQALKLLQAFSFYISSAY